MSGSLLLRTIREKSVKIDELLKTLKFQLEQVKQKAAFEAYSKEEEILKKDNQLLKQEIEKLKEELRFQETFNGVSQIPSSLKISKDTTSVTTSIASFVPHPSQPKPTKQLKKEIKKENKTNDTNETSVDVSKLNMRIGKVVEVQKHPDADALYVEKVDLGEGKLRTVVSGLVKHVPIKQLQNKVAVFLTNLKPAKMRGVISEAMIMCASTPEKVEIIQPPEGVHIGERVMVEQFLGEPEEQLNPKKKIWETIQPDLKIDNQGFASYKGYLWTISGKGHFKASTLKNTSIK